MYILIFSILMNTKFQQHFQYSYFRDIFLGAFDSFCSISGYLLRIHDYYIFLSKQQTEIKIISSKQIPFQTTKIFN